MGAALALAASWLAPIAAQAQQYPSQDIHFVTGYPAGSGADVIVRYFADKLRPVVNRTIIVENKPGAGANIGIEYVARSKPDGYTILIHPGSGLAANMHLFKKPPVDVGKAFQIVATLNKLAFTVVVDAKKPWKTVAELTAFLKDKKEKATYATAAPTGVVMGALYKQFAGIEAVDVNYKTSSDSLNDMLSGAVDYGTLEPVYSLAQAREGRLRVLAVSSGQRLAALPDLPTMAEAGVPGIDITGWWSAEVPAGTPKAVVDQLNRWFNQIVATEETRKFLNRFGSDPFITSPEEGQALLEKDIKAWGEYIRLAKIEPQG